MSDAAPSVKKRNAFTAVEIVAQIDQVRDWIVAGERPNAIRRMSAERWGLACRTAEQRMHDARTAMVRDITGIDRQQFAAQLIEAASEIQKAAQDTRQLSNALGALRLQSEILGITGRNA